MCATAMALLVVGCSTQPTTSTSTSAGASPTSTFSATDVAWIQLMIPMSERAQRLTDMAPSRRASPAVAALAARTGSRLREDLRELRELLKLSGVPDTRPHEGHDMPGMVSLATLGKAGTATGETFDKILTDALREHLTQSRMLGDSERTQGHATKATDLAVLITKRMTEQIAWLNEIRPARPPAPEGTVKPTRS
ncbi:DUF305 domain-containing protein [Streptomyces sp. NPDC088387]|uniref:DUF305 domain-containing protein n=1 Tax=Streptomyces sp. NPDC088387 TaxID=3365859 RepID=UPI0038126459